MADPVTITLAGQTFPIQPLNLGQIEEVADALGAAAGAKAFERTLKILATALKVSGRADLTPDVLRGMMITPDEMRAAQDVVLKHTGLIKAGEAPAPAPAGAQA